MKRPVFRPLDESLSPRFILPVIGENMLTIVVGLIFSSIISVISSSALAAIGMANTVMALVFSVFSVVITGASVLVSRQIGARDSLNASDTIEQATLFSAALSIAATILAVLTATPVMRLLMPTAEAQMFSEAVRYYRTLMLSLPFYVLHSALSSVCRATGDSRNPLLVAILMNLVQLALGYLLIVMCGLEEIGAGMAYVGCRMLGAGLMLLLLLREHRHFALSVKRMLRPRFAVMGRILRIGIPVSIESLFVQVGYLLANSMAIALGAFEAGVHQVLTTINTIPGLPQGICATIAMSAVGHLLGAQKEKEARKAGMGVWAVGIAISAALCGILMLVVTPFAGLYSSDPETIRATASLVWVLLLFDIPAVSINAMDPQLRAGGDVKFVMVVTLTAVWLIRLPLSYLFCFVLDGGVMGLWVANSISLYYRAILGLLRHRGEKWIHRKI